MRIVLVHERFTELGGSELVVGALHQQWPDAPIRTSVLDRAMLPPALSDAAIRPSPLQRLYRGGTGYAHLLPLLPQAMARLDVRDERGRWPDAVVVSHHAFANRIALRLPREVPVVSYVHTPARWMWDPAHLANEVGGGAARAGLGAFARAHRRGDRAAARAVHTLVANSRHSASRIDRYWGLGCRVVHPPVDVGHFRLGHARREDFFLLAGRLVPYKRPEVAVAAARRAGVRLVVVGDGRHRDAVADAAGDSDLIDLVGAVDGDRFRDLLQRCRALVFPGEEDFGMVPVEAQACGAPVIALGVGGVLDSVVDGVTGHLYEPDPTDEVGALARALTGFDPTRYDRGVVRAHAEGFGPDAFRARMAAIVAEAASAR